ncbi:unnamed protein product [Candidula unifasciata]|uniref:Uncharacterized protein n=1 Tax=Candidula unifasciata TaxID=100452 RepID=A0A8S3ZM77_9EUPU|nr:unnamed protein product [Candidula unifasciata]
MCIEFLKFISATTSFIGIFMLHCAANTTTSHMERLFAGKILSTDHRYRPQLNQSEATRVNLSLVHYSLMDVDEVQQSLASNVLLVVTWVDETRSWDPNEYGGISKVHPEPSDIWKPRFFLTNSIGSRDIFEDDYAPLTIFSDGLTVWRPGGMMYTYCLMKMTHFPFDTQTCSLNLTTGETAETLRLLSASSKPGTYSDKSGEWLIKKSTIRTVTQDNIYHVKYILQLNRLSSFTVLNMVIPVNIISSISSLTFLIPVTSGERVSFSITVLLSLTVYTGEISKDLPTNSESLPLLIMYLACLLLHSGFVIVANLVVLKRHFLSFRRGTGTKDSIPRGLSFTKKLSDPNLQDHLSGEQETSLTYTHNTSSKENLFLRRHSFDSVNNVQHKRSTSSENDSESSKESTCQQGFSLLLKSYMFNYISVPDFWFFLVSFVLWLLITGVFMTLMAFGF